MSTYLIRDCRPVNDAARGSNLELVPVRVELVVVCREVLGRQFGVDFKKNILRSAITIDVGKPVVPTHDIRMYRKLQ